MKLKFQKLDENATLPTRATDGSAGYDLYNPWPNIILAGKEVARVPLGIAVAIPDGWAGLIIPRSSMYSRGLDACGLIDSDYRGELTAVFQQLESGPVVQLKAGERIAQLLVVPHFKGVPTFVEKLSDTARGSGGFGSTGR